jgi:hypothetical protein
MRVLCNSFQDKWSALLRVCELLGSHSVSINVTGESELLGNTFCKFKAPNIAIDLSNLPIDDNDESIEQRMILLTGWKSNSPSKALILEIYSKIELSPGDLSRNCSGYSNKNFSPALLKLSEIGLIISKGEEFVSICLIHQSDFYIPMYFVVFNCDRLPIFPHKEVFHANLSNIFSHSHLKDLNDVFFRPNGTFLYVYGLGLEVTNSDILSDGLSLRALLEKDRRMKYSLFGAEVNFLENKKIVMQDNVHFTCCRTESEAFALLVYFKKKVIYWEFKKNDGRKRVREECLEIEVKDKSLINQMTGHLEWNQKSFNILHDVAGGSRKKQIDE